MYPGPAGVFAVVSRAHISGAVDCGHAPRYSLILVKYI